MDKNGKWFKGSNKFTKQMNKALKNNRRLPAVMGLLALIANEANGQNCERLSRMKKLMSEYENVDPGSPEEQFIVAEMATINQQLFMNDSAATVTMEGLLR